MLGDPLPPSLPPSLPASRHAWPSDGLWPYCPVGAPARKSGLSEVGRPPEEHGADRPQTVGEKGRLIIPQ